MHSRYYKNLLEIDFEDSENKEIIPIENFCFKVLMEINGCNRFYNDILVGAIDAVSHKYQIKCKESYGEVFNYISNQLRGLEWQ